MYAFILTDVGYFIEDKVLIYIKKTVLKKNDCYDYKTVIINLCKNM